MAKYRLLIGPVVFGNLQDAFIRDLTVRDIWPGSHEPDPIVILERFCTGISAVLKPFEDEVTLEVVWTLGNARTYELRDAATNSLVLALL